ncbi:hypothetical protein SEVIR_4G247500v4 [Setaria viridis]|uniref:Uncharacterized protein n=1 Tax=Setaria viridis TaxID=4556 RepID=A0A4V6D8N0_SETVI|nr:hypothetical protein SEVIR_4G247500v2 [Setaria viridis]
MDPSRTAQPLRGADLGRRPQHGVTPRRLPLIDAPSGGAAASDDSLAPPPALRSRHTGLQPWAAMAPFLTEVQISPICVAPSRIECKESIFVLMFMRMVLDFLAGRDSGTGAAGCTLSVEIQAAVLIC